jgi:hypothetical protein
MESFAYSSGRTKLYLSLQQLSTSAVTEIRLKILERVEYLKL